MCSVKNLCKHTQKTKQSIFQITSYNLSKLNSFAQERFGHLSEEAWLSSHFPIGAITYWCPLECFVKCAVS